jgi:hypothetical protein
MLAVQTCPAAAALAILVYDYLLTIEDEIRYIWRRPLTNIKVFYVILRYGAAFAQIIYFQGKSQLEGTELGIHIVSIALSGLIMYKTQKVRLSLSALHAKI